MLVIMVGMARVTLIVVMAMCDLYRKRIYVEQNSSSQKIIIIIIIINDNNNFDFVCFGSST